MFKLSKNIYLMSLVMSLNFATISMMVLIAGLLGAKIAPSPELATLPVAMMVVGTAVAAIPAAMLMQKLGRKLGMSIGGIIALCGAGLAYFAALNSHFTLFVIAAFMIGSNAAFTQQGRFIIIENSETESQQADGLTLALMANLFAAIVGPLLGAYGRDMMPDVADYTGSFLLLGALLLIAQLVLSQYKNLAIGEDIQEQSQRPLWSLFKQPLFILAAGSAAVGYGVMSFIMTATPISMHEINGHSLQNTTLVIQTHLVAMYLPSLLSGYLLKRGFSLSLIITGLCLYLLLGLIAYNGQAVLHYWWALLLLGIGWNLLFMTSTSLLPHTYLESEKFKAQAANDFIVFSTQAATAFLAGWVLFNLGWEGVLTISVLISCVWLGLVLWLNSAINRVRP